MIPSQEFKIETKNNLTLLAHIDKISKDIFHGYSQLNNQQYHLITDDEPTAISAYQALINNLNLCLNKQDPPDEISIDSIDSIGSNEELISIIDQQKILGRDVTINVNDK